MSFTQVAGSVKVFEFFTALTYLDLSSCSGITGNVRVFHICPELAYLSLLGCKKVRCPATCPVKDGKLQYTSKERCQHLIRWLQNLEVQEKACNSPLLSTGGNRTNSDISDIVLNDDGTDMDMGEQTVDRFGEELRSDGVIELMETRSFVRAQRSPPMSPTDDDDDELKPKRPSGDSPKGAIPSRRSLFRGQGSTRTRREVTAAAAPGIKLEAELSSL